MDFVHDALRTQQQHQRRLARTSIDADANTFLIYGWIRGHAKPGQTALEATRCSATVPWQSNYKGFKS
jgi:hypothetical protein